MNVDSTNTTTNTVPHNCTKNEDPLYNNDFFNEDLVIFHCFCLDLRQLLIFFNFFKYDYRDTFNTNTTKSKKSAGDFLNFYEIDEDCHANSIDEELDKDDNNYFVTGPLSTSNKKSYINDENINTYQIKDERGIMDSFFKRVDSMDLIKHKKTKIIKNYLIGEILGDGSYGKVKECLDLDSLSRRAVKIINLKLVSRKIPHGVQNVRKEIKIMKQLNHKNIIKLYDTFEKFPYDEKNAINYNIDYNDDILKSSIGVVSIEKPPKLYIFMDYCITNLEKILKNAPEQRFNNFQSSYYFKQLIDGLEYLHSLYIIHNDIKPSNLLITCDDILKICDFSISVELNRFCYYDSVSLNDNANNFFDQDENSVSDFENEINPHLLPNIISNTSKKY
jgi:hypothetical protein